MAHGFEVVCTKPLLDTASFLAASLHVCSFLPWGGHCEDWIALKVTDDPDCIGKCLCQCCPASVATKKKMKHVDCVHVSMQVCAHVEAEEDVGCPFSVTLHLIP